MKIFIKIFIKFNIINNIINFLNKIIQYIFLLKMKKNLIINYFIEIMKKMSDNLNIDFVRFIFKLMNKYFEFNEESMSISSSSKYLFINLNINLMKLIFELSLIFSMILIKQFMTRFFFIFKRKTP